MACKAGNVGESTPTFFAAGGKGAARRIVALEIQSGDHLQNPDTDYKRDVLDFLSQSFAWDSAVPAGQLQLQQTGETVECTLILMQDVPTKLPSFLKKPCLGGKTTSQAVFYCGVLLVGK